MIDDIYTLEELIKKMENVKEGKDEALNLPKAFLSLAYEIQKIKQDSSEASQAYEEPREY